MRTIFPIVVGLCCCSAPAQRLTILLDPARGGTEDGARIDDHTPEKQVTLDLANHLRALLNARDFNVVVTREADVTVSNDARAALANQSKPIACLLLHATAAGKGLHLFTSSLQQTAPQTVAVPWDEAQAPFAQRSQRLENELSTAFGRAKVPVSSGHTWIRPLDNMQCPAVALEIAPEPDGTTASNHNYQTRIADTIAGALLFWRGHLDIVGSIVAAPPETKVAPPESAPASAGSAGMTGTAATHETTQTNAGTAAQKGTAAPADKPALPRKTAPSLNGTAVAPRSTTVPFGTSATKSPLSGASGAPAVPRLGTSVTARPASPGGTSTTAPKPTGTSAIRPPSARPATDPNAIAPVRVPPARAAQPPARPAPTTAKPPARPADGSVPQ